MLRIGAGRRSTAEVEASGGCLAASWEHRFRQCPDEISRRTTSSLARPLHASERWRANRHCWTDRSWQIKHHVSSLPSDRALWGQIRIDGIDISTVGLHDLRSRLAIIPQDPTLFKGTIRSNLDPFHEHTDLELWSALRKADLVGAETDHTERPPTADATVEGVGRIHLDSVVEEEGLNFSLGQRQLMALARALVRDSRIIVCDEATSSVDFETDRKIQETMATGFKGKTLLCIAHRLKTK